MGQQTKPDIDRKRLRATAAIAAMQALIQWDTAVSVELKEPTVTNPMTVASKAVRYADALLEELGRE